MKAVQMIQKRQRWAMLVAAGMLSICASQTQAVLSVANGDFATGAGNNINDVTGWFDSSTGDFWQGTWQTDNGAITPNGSAVVVLGSYEDGAIQASMSADVQVGNYLYQSIGTADGTNTLEISFEFGAPNDDPGGRSLGLTVGVYAYDGLGGFTAADTNDVHGASGITLLDSASYSMTSTGVDGLISNVVASLDISGAGSQELFLRFNNYRPGNTESWPVVDNVFLANSLPPFYPMQVSPSGTGTTNPVTMQAVIKDWGSQFDSVEMYLDGALVIPDSVNTVSSTTTVSYAVAGTFDALSVHTGKVVVAGTLPVAYATNEWTFTMQPPLTFVSGSPEGAGASDAPTIEVVIADGVSDLDAGSVSLYLDNTNILVDYTYPDTPVAGQTTIGGIWFSTVLEPGSTHTGKVVYAGINPAAGPYTNTWTFSVAGDPGYGIYIGDTNAPTPGASDIYQFDVPGTDWDNIGGVVSNTSGANDGSTYVASDKDLHQGQLFTTGGSSSFYALSSVWVKHVAYTNFVNNGTFYNLVDTDGDQVVVRIVDPAQADTVDFVVGSETLTVVSNSIAGGSDNGTGNWIELRLQTPVVLDGSKQYGFDLMIESSQAAYFELAGVQTDSYGGGDAYTTSPRGTMNTGTVHAGNDRTFLVALAPSSGGGPTVTPNITSFTVSGGSATLMWDSETGVSYGVLHKAALTGGTWTEVTNVLGAGASTMATVPAGSSEDFFQIEGN